MNKFEEISKLTTALERTYLLGGLCDKAAADLCDIKYCHFQRMMNPGDSRNFPPDSIETLLRVSHNLFALEWLAWRFGMALYPLELMEVLKDIRGALAGDHKAVRFFEQIVNRQPGDRYVVNGYGGVSDVQR